METVKVPDEGDERTFTVTELLSASREHLNNLWQERVWVVGELSNVRQYPSGHVYMTLKDERAEVSCIMYASVAENHPELPGDGIKVRALVLPTIYVQKGRFQLVVEEVWAQGAGRLHEQYLLTKEKLRSLGWFDQGRKRDLARMPSSVAVVVSLQGSAWRDLQKTLGERFPTAKVLVFPAPAQGDAAAGLIAKAIAKAGKSGCDTMLVCRGGGSFEDLWSYNEAVVAEAILNSPIPVVTGIGHETDETIADFVADFRAATPTGAAVAAVPSRAELARRLSSLEKRLRDSVAQATDDAHQGLDDAVASLLRAQQSVESASWRLERHAGDLQRMAGAITEQRLLSCREHAQALQRHAKAVCLRLHDRLTQDKTRIKEEALRIRGTGMKLTGHADRLANAAAGSVSSKQGSMAHLRSRLVPLHPRRTLERGYAIVTGVGGRVMSSTGQLRDGDSATVNFADGEVGVKVDDGAPVDPIALGDVE